MKSEFVNDSLREKIVHKYLETYLYPNIINRSDGKSVSFTVFEDEEHQKQGIDVELDWDNTKILIDEKSATDYVKKPLDTFVLEVSFLSQNGKRVEGWYLRDDLETDYYLFCWVKAVEGILNEVDDIVYVDCALVEKQRLRGSALEPLKVEVLRKYNNPLLFVENARYKVEPFNNKMYLMFTKNKNEQPINLVVHRDIYSHYAKFFCRVYKNGIKLLK